MYWELWRMLTDLWTFLLIPVICWPRNRSLLNYSMVFFTFNCATVILKIKYCALAPLKMSLSPQLHEVSVCLSENLSSADIFEFSFFQITIPKYIYELNIFLWPYSLPLNLKQDFSTILLFFSWLFFGDIYKAEWPSLIFLPKLTVTVNVHKYTIALSRTCAATECAPASVALTRDRSHRPLGGVVKVVAIRTHERDDVTNRRF